MSATILDGKALSKEIRAEIAEQVAAFKESGGPTPCLAAVLVGEDPASQIYVRNKEKACEKAGMGSVLHRLSAETTTDQLLELVDQLNGDASIHGILIQLPLPDQIDETRVLDAVNPIKDVDAFHPENVGRIVQGRPRFLPCTPHGIQQLLLRNAIQTAGQNVTVIGRSEIVGKPMSLMFMQRGEGGKRNRNRLPQPDEGSSRRNATGGYSRGRHRPGEVRHARHGQAGGHCDRRRHESNGRGAVRGCGLRGGQGSGRSDHAGSRWCGAADDHDAVA